MLNFGIVCDDDLNFDGDCAKARPFGITAFGIYHYFVLVASFSTTQIMGLSSIPPKPQNR